jgi:glycosyltransferase involved in cell wall biosynthesis
MGSNTPVVSSATPSSTRSTRSGSAGSTPEKGPHLAIDAARRAGRPLVIAGPGSDPDYFARDVEPRLGGEVRYAGHLAHRELAHLVGASAAALVTPQWDEPYGLVVAEAMMCSRPVVALACGGIPEIVDPEGGRLVSTDRRRSGEDHSRSNRSLCITLAHAATKSSTNLALESSCA